tara:strand:+ start:30536 stop:31045 length:510 start_codon:yes stop_codon:yes gene_type:complete
MVTMTRFNTGQVGEYSVAAALARYGFTVALPTGNAPNIDVLAYRHSIQLAIQVKTTKHPNFQFQLNRFLDISFGSDGQQLIKGIKPDLDKEISMVLVSLGKQSSDDGFIWTTLIEFAEYLKTSHEKYLAKHGGRRPGKNPFSMHAAHTRKELEEAFPISTAAEFIGRYS